jgi:sec-independent protein translocase protein TatA
MLEGLFQPTHLILILAMAVLVFGPKKLPELGQGLGKGIRGFKDALSGVRSEPERLQSDQSSDASK